MQISWAFLGYSRLYLSKMICALQIPFVNPYYSKYPYLLTFAKMICDYCLFVLLIRLRQNPEFSINKFNNTLLLNRRKKVGYLVELLLLR